MAFDFSRWSTPPSPGWELCDGEARSLRTTAGRVADFKRRQGLPRDERLSDTARALLALELEADHRAAIGQQIARAQALDLIAQRATAEAAQALAAVVPFPAQMLHAGIWVSWCDLEAYLLNRAEALTGKRYATAGAACRKAATLAPAAAAAAAALQTRGGAVARPDHCDRFRFAWFWGVVLRLDQLEGPPPADPLAFYRWSQLEAYEIPAPDPTCRLADLLSGRMGEGEARALLELPVSGPLEGAAIRAAYRAQARTAHPDAGGDRHRFERLSEARDRLLLAAAAGVGQ